MDEHALEFFRSYSDEFPHSHFHRVIALHDEPTVDWTEVSTLCPKLCRGWFELAKLSVQDRIEFKREFWCAKFTNYPEFIEFLLFKFFNHLDDIGIYLTQRSFDDPFEVQCVYSLKNNSGFYIGLPPAKENEIIDLQKDFPDYILSADYLNFLQIHNGFAKLNDTGLTKSHDMKECYHQFQQMLEKGDPVTTTRRMAVNPKALIPFYQSFSMPFFQCFWGEWYPDREMGNVYYSGFTRTISDYTPFGVGVETMAFETFTDWLMFYLETIE